MLKAKFVKIVRQPNNEKESTKTVTSAGLQMGLMTIPNGIPTDSRVLRLQPAAGHWSTSPAKKPTNKQPTTNNDNKLK